MQKPIFNRLFIYNRNFNDSNFNDFNNFDRDQANFLLLHILINFASGGDMHDMRNIYFILI